MDSHFDIRLQCEECGLAVYVLPENIIDRDSDFINLKISYEELELIIEKLQELKFMIDQTSKENITNDS